jgi:P27 family predicted phage terminase small subunit
MGVMAKVHSIALTLLVEAVADWLRLKAKAETTPDCTTGQNGAEFPHPIHGMKAKAWDKVLKACREFGMTPSAISAVRVVKPEEKKTGLGAFKIG